MLGSFFTSQDLNRFMQELGGTPNQIASMDHSRWCEDFKKRAEETRHEVVHEIRQAFVNAFPGRFYVFLVKRPRDHQAWPVVFSNKELADKYLDRVSPVVEVLL